jgi:hypothetical protein
MEIKKSITPIISLLIIIFISLSLNSCKDTPVIPQNAEAEIAHIEFANIIGEASIDRANRTVTAEIYDRPNSDMGQLVLLFVLSNGATAYIDDVEQISGATVNDFSVGEVIYTIVSGDGKTTKKWSVTILKRPDTATYQLNGFIKENTILSAATYEIKNDLEVAEGVYFAIEAGSTIKFVPNARMILNDSVRFFANGTASSPIKFTSMNASNGFDDNVWSDIYVKNPKEVEFSYCIFENGGGYNGRPLMYLENSVVGIKFCTFRNILNTGIYLDENSVFRIFEDNKFDNCGETVEGCYPIHLKDVNSILNFEGGNTINTSKGIYIETANITNNLTFVEQTCPYIIGSDITHSGNNIAVFIQQGVSIIMSSGKSINLGNNNSAIKFIARGTQEKPIKFSSKENQKGSWEGIIFGSRTLSGSMLEYCEINFAGNGETSGAIKCIGTDSTSLSIINCTISNTNSHGIYVAKNSSVQMQGLQFFNIGYINIYYEQ